MPTSCTCSKQVTAPDPALLCVFETWFLFLTLSHFWAQLANHSVTGDKMTRVPAVIYFPNPLWKWQELVCK